MRSLRRNVIMSSPKRFRAEHNQSLKNRNQILACFSSLGSSALASRCLVTALMCLLEPQWASHPRRQYRMFASRMVWTRFMISLLCSRISSVITTLSSSSSPTCSFTTLLIASCVSISTIPFSAMYLLISRSFMEDSIKSRSLISIRLAIITSLTRPLYCFALRAYQLMSWRFWASGIIWYSSKTISVIGSRTTCGSALPEALAAACCSLLLPLISLPLAPCGAAATAPVKLSMLCGLGTSLRMSSKENFTSLSELPSMMAVFTCEYVFSVGMISSSNLYVFPIPGEPWMSFQSISQMSSALLIQSVQWRGRSSCFIMPASALTLLRYSSLSCWHRAV
mmetsp:Transcript_49078/g.87549  ORF Transcript_49078/g.87549 Transcript_49078/m.87549 type:complete len:338 (-) Transcript_49078:7779-8792(-)